MDEGDYVIYRLLRSENTAIVVAAQKEFGGFQAVEYSSSTLYLFMHVHLHLPT